MSRPRPEEDLAAIVRRGASRPARKIILAVAVLAVLGGVSYFLFFRKGKTDHHGPEYITRPAARTDIAILVTASGNLEPTNKIVIGSELSGIVTEVYVDTNDAVKKEQPLLKLDTSKLEQQINRSRASLLAAKARVSQAEATLNEARASLSRQEELLELSGGKTPSRAVMDTSRASVARAEADLESARAAVSGAEAEVGALETDLQKAVIRSPVDGVVLGRSIEIGQTVAASFNSPTLFTIAEDLKKMELVVAVSEADIGRVQAGQTASFDVDAWPGRTYSASVQKVAFGSTESTSTGGGNSSSSGSGGVVTYETELSVDNEDLSLRPGMTATVDIAVVDLRDVLAIPNAALRFDPEVYAALDQKSGKDETLVQSLTPGPGRWRRNRPRAGAQGPPAVWILKDGKPFKVDVKIGITDGSVTEVTGGDLKPGDEVITSIQPTAP